MALQTRHFVLSFRPFLAKTMISLMDFLSDKLTLPEESRDESRLAKRYKCPGERGRLKFHSTPVHQRLCGAELFLTYSLRN